MIDVKPLMEVDGIKFDTDRDLVRKKIGKNYQEIKKTPFSKNTMDAYKNFHVYYSPDNKFEAIEIFGNEKVVVDGKEIFPGEVGRLKEVFPSIEEDSEGWIDQKLSIGVTVSQNDETLIEAILFGCKDYYSL